MNRKPNGCTVAELIAALQALPDHSVTVDIEGCDCTGPAIAELDGPYPGSGTAEIAPWVLIQRHPDSI